MNLKLKTKYALFGVMALMQTNAFAQHDSVGHGGTYVTLPDDTVVVGDQFIPDNADLNGKQGKRIELSDELKSELNRADILINKFSGVAVQESTPFFAKSVFAPNIEYRLVDSLDGVHCDFSEIPLDAEHQADPHGAFGCSRGKYTYLVTAPYTKMSLREKALGIIHERLRTTELGNRDTIYSSLKSVYLGLKVGLNQFDREQKGKFVSLTTDEIQTLADFSTTLANEKIANNADLTTVYASEAIPASKIFSGGSVFKNSMFSDQPSSYLGIATELEGNYGEGVSDKIGKNSIVSPSNLAIFPNDFTIGDNSSIKGHFKFSGSILIGMTIGHNSTLSNVDLIVSKTKNATCQNRMLNSDDENNSLVKVGSNVELTDSTLQLNNQVCAYSNSIQIADQSKIKNTNIAGRPLDLFRSVPAIIGGVPLFTGWMLGMVVSVVPVVAEAIFTPRNSPKNDPMDVVQDLLDRARDGKIALKLAGDFENLKCDFTTIKAKAKLNDRIIRKHCGELSAK